MESQKENSLRKKIIEGMTVDYSNALEKNFDLAKQFIRITKDGKVDVLSKDKLSGKEQLLLYLIGKLYAKEAGFAATDDVGNKELLDELGIPSGSLLPWLKELRAENKIKQIKKGKYTHHSISVNWIEKTLKNVEKKMKKYV
jgi:predicted DNA-binding protein